MPSNFGWVDFEERDRQKMLEVIKMFQEQDTRDELGIGTIRDAFSDLLFPGTSTIQTRVKYMLFVPWIYLRHEEKKTTSAEISRKVREDEVTLISALKNSDDTYGIIGVEAGAHLQRMPSQVYWSGLARWGIRQFRGSIDELHRSIEHYYAAKKNVIVDDDKMPVAGMVHDNWHPGIPDAPEGFPYQASFRLSREEAEYLLDRILHNCKKSLLAHLVSRGYQSNVDFIWEHSALDCLPGEMRSQILHARNFAISMHGAALLYNYLLAEKRDDQSLVERYLQKISEWAEMMESVDSSKWDRGDFWDLVQMAGQIPIRTRHFVDDWLSVGCCSKARHTLTDNHDARQLITLRERWLKRDRSRLENRRALELWSGASGTSMLSYRWPVAQGMVNDIVAGLWEEH